MVWHPTDSGVLAVADSTGVFVMDLRMLGSGTFAENNDAFARPGIRRLPLDDFVVNSISFSNNGHLLALGSSNGIVSIWDWQGTKCVSQWTATKDGDPVPSLQFIPSATAVASPLLLTMGGRTAVDLKLWNCADWQLVQSVHFSAGASAASGQPMINSISLKPSSLQLHPALNLERKIHGI